VDVQDPRPAAGRPLARWLVPAGAVLAAVLLAAYAYHRGQVAGGLDAAQVLIERRELTAKAERLEKQNAELNARVAELEMSRKLDREAYGQVEKTLGELQSQLSRQGDDLAFYRSIVSPADGIQGLRIQRFAVEPGGGPREFVLKVTLIQAMRHESMASGLAEVVVHGMQGDRPARYSVGELLGRPKAQLPFSFRYFQTLEQAVTLPEGFQAFEAEVQVRSSKLRFPMQQSFPWKVGEEPPAA
jgi:outer membrane murein-binding lipoprotein Lpp